MKIATNVKRDAFGGIAISNMALFDWLNEKENTVIGLEIITQRYLSGASIFRHYSPSFFHHRIINGIDIIPKHSWEKRGNPKKKWRILIETAKKILQEEDPDIFLVNGTYQLPWILTQAAKDLGIPIVLRYAGVLSKEEAHKGFFARKRLLAYEKWMASSANYIIFPSKICQKVVEEEVLGYKIKNCSVIPNPAEINKRINKTRKKITERYTVAMIGRWSRIKNFDGFISLHQELLKKEWPHKAIIVTPRDIKNIPETIELKKSMSHDELLDFYHSIDLLVVPSHFETFSNVSAEAILSGVPILTSKKVGFSEILVKAGLKRMVIDSFDNPEEVAAALKRIADKKLTEQEINKVAKLIHPDKLHLDKIKILKREISILKKRNGV
jgi:glycosyltransferase involved in cell wall biosynthesis